MKTTGKIQSSNIVIEKIIWALDPTQNPNESKSIVKELNQLAKYLNCEIQPVSIFSKFAEGISLESGSPWKENFELIARKSVDLFIKKSQAKNFLPPELIYTTSNSTRKMATEIARYAERKNAFLICAYTRAKKSWIPFRMGSFSETLVASSKVPVLLVNPSAVVSDHIPCILFPTDFSRESKNALVKLERFAKAFKSKILLFNQVVAPNFYSTEVNVTWETPEYNLEALMKEIEEDRLKKAKNWSKFLESKGIACSFVIQRENKSLGTEILAVAKKNKIHLIALASLSGPLTQAIIGSIVKDILLKAVCPVLIFFRPKAIRKRVRKSQQQISEKYPRTEAVVVQ